MGFNNGGVDAFVANVRASQAGQGQVVCAFRIHCEQKRTRKGVEKFVGHDKGNESRCGLVTGR